MCWRSVVTLLGVLNVGLLLAGCDGRPSTEPEPEGWVSAIVQSAERAVDYEGTGHFYTYEISDNPYVDFEDEVLWLSIFSAGIAGSDSAEFSLLGTLPVPPATGQYELGSFAGPGETVLGSGPALYAMYREVYGDSMVHYLIVDGVIEITESTDEVVAGTFSLEASGGIFCTHERYDAGGDWVTGSGFTCHFPPNEVSAGVQIEGSFHAIRLELCELGSVWTDEFDVEEMRTLPVIPCRNHR